MNFVDDVDFVFALGWCDNGTFAEVANIINASVASGIDFDDIEIVILEFIFETINFVSKNAGDGGFAGAAGANKKIGVRKFAGFDGTRQHVCDLRLPDDL